MADAKYIPAASFDAVHPAAAAPVDLQGVQPLPLGVRMSDFLYGGQLQSFGGGYRLAVSMDLQRYVMQSFVPELFAFVPSGGKSPATLSGIVSKYSGAILHLGAIASTLPDDPADAVQVFAARRRATLAVLAARDLAAANYSRVVAHDGQLRLSVDPDGNRYVLQWASRASVPEPSTRWKAVYRSADLQSVFDYLMQNAYDPAERLDVSQYAARWNGFLSDLPELAAAGKWSPIPAAVPQLSDLRQLISAMH